MFQLNFSKPLLISITLIFYSVSVTATSIDCTRATTEIDKIICDEDNYLNEDDDRLNNLFAQLLILLTSQAEQLKKEQRDWLAQRDLCLQDKVSPIGCLAQQYEERSASLFVTYLQTLVIRDEKARLASLITFPLEVDLEGNKKIVLHDEQQFLDHYDQVMTESVEAALLTQDPNHLSTHRLGKKIGQGEIWFKGTRIITINNSGIKPPLASSTFVADNNHPIDKTTAACVKKYYSKTGMVKCFNQAYDQWNQELEIVYSSLVKHLEKEQQPALKQTQNAWIKYKDSQFEVLNQIYNPLEGTMWMPIKTEAGVNLIKNRVLELQTYLDSLRQSGKIPSVTPLTTQPNNHCDVWAFVTDTDSKGLNIRSAPKKGIISRIPYNDYEGFTSVHIIDAKEGWLRIDRWEDFYTTVTIDKEAWIYGKLLGTFVKGYQQGWTYAYADPSKAAQTEDKFLGEREVNILDCKGEWLLVEGESVANQTIKGWLPPQEQCPNAITTCPSD